MPVFIYSAKSNTGEIKTGSQEANSEAELAHALREQGFVLTSVRSASQPLKTKSRLADFLPSFSFIPLSEKMIFARHLAVMIGAGLSLNRALETLSQQTKNKRFAKIINFLSEDIKKGLPLAEALNKHPKVFSNLFVNMVRVGETGGNLEGVLKIITNQMEKEHELKSKIRNAMIYPAVIIVSMLGIGFLMMVLVVPKLLQIFKEMNVDLPLSTRLIILASDFLSRHWLVSLEIFFILFLVLYAIAKLKITKFYFDWVILRLPVFGEIAKKINSARLARTLGSLIESGVPIVQGLQIVAGTLSNIHFYKSLFESASLVQKGAQLSQSIKNYPQLYPVMVSQMMEVGEETGTLGEILGKLADFYEEDISNVTKGLASIIEPILMVVIGAAVGFFAISMVQPMYSIMEGM
jgi:type IV pilus assembly protein PilC